MASQRKSESTVAASDAQTAYQYPYTNRLIHEKNPYLLLHAHNPVDWYPWGQEAFAMAKRENKPIFLSVGYYTCHWCHVIERESYSNPAIAELLNRWFVSIKVDPPCERSEPQPFAPQDVNQGSANRAVARPNILKSGHRRNREVVNTLRFAHRL